MLTGGRLCLGGALGRDPSPVFSGVEGLLTREIDPWALPGPNGPRAALPGETWFFQWMFRDEDPWPTSNFTDAVAVRFE